MKLRAKVCPKCNKTDIIMVAGGTIGVWKCKDCGFQASVFPEKEIIPKINKSKQKKK